MNRPMKKRKKRKKRPTRYRDISKRAIQETYAPKWIQFRHLLLRETLMMCQKRPTNIYKETYDRISLKRQIRESRSRDLHRVATISRPLKIIGLFCKRALWKRPVFSKETCNLKEPTNRSHPITELQRNLLKRVLTVVDELSTFIAARNTHDVSKEAYKYVKKPVKEP